MVQDEVGHGQILYRVAEDLGKSRDQMFDDLVNGRTKFHNVFHYPTETWGDVAVIGWLIDGAALVTQKALLDSSYMPYVRAMRRICAEESLHLRHGEELALELVSGTPEQREMFQDAVNRWWRPIMHFYGPPSNPAKDVLLYWGIKTRSNEDLRDEFFSTYVPKLWDVGITVPDPALRYAEDEGRWVWGAPEWVDWDEFWTTVRGNGPMTSVRLLYRKAMWDTHAWVREVFAAIPASA
jgi:ring-1,2-phenylacetyl-CoA epoxidase subunit PaaA